MPATRSDSKIDWRVAEFQISPLTGLKNSTYAARSRNTQKPNINERMKSSLLNSNPVRGEILVEKR